MDHSTDFLIPNPAKINIVGKGKKFLMYYFNIDSSEIFYIRSIRNEQSLLCITACYLVEEMYVLFLPKSKLVQKRRAKGWVFEWNVTNLCCGLDGPTVPHRVRKLWCVLRAPSLPLLFMLKGADPPHCTLTSHLQLRMRGISWVSTLAPNWQTPMVPIAPLSCPMSVPTYMLARHHHGLCPFFPPIIGYSGS